MTRDSAVLQLRLDDRLKRAFADAAHRESTTPSRAMRALMEQFVRDSHRKEAARQSRVVAEAADYDETMDDIARVSEWVHD